MNWHCVSLMMTGLAIAVPLEAVYSQVAAATEVRPSALQLAQAQTRRSSGTVRFNPPRRGAPPATVGLGSRGDCIESEGDAFRVLAPTASLTGQSSTLGLTTAAHPALFAYVPAHYGSAQAISLRLMQVTGDEQETELYAQTFAMPNTSGIVQLRPDRTLPPLEVGQVYHWYVSVVCNSIDQSGNAVVEGWIERIRPDAALAQGLEQAEPIGKAMLYGQAGVWHDTLLTLAEAYNTQSGDPNLQATWQDLLQTVGLGAIAESPLLECCQPLD